MHTAPHCKSLAAPCRGTVNLASCFRKEHCIWLSGACVRRSASIPPPFALPVDIFATKERLEAIWLMSPYPILPPVPWKLTLVYSITYSLVMLIIIISKCIKTVFNFFRARRLRNLQLEQERAERERANHNQGDTIFIYYPNTETMLARNDILKTDEYQVVLVHRSLINGSLPDNNLIERLRHLSVSHGQQQIPVTNNGSLAQWNTPPPTVVILRQDNPENNETTV
ncbi:hypothetical protein Ocin01_04683 [Orchesella cincta]|uniref:Uncharacterized protein n=1 Tax=Orchesella cincta TaxID=48709 RepID=A0A1D2N9Q2_ORCCI|nr:hypothetical protein Ocin01_04683 [Orchesella cincta]